MTNTQKRAQLLRECEEIRAVEFTDATRAAFDAKMAQVEVLDLVLRHNLGDEFGVGLIERNLPPTEARAAILDKLVTNQEGTAVRNQNPSITMGPSGSDQVRAMSEALAARYGGPAPSDAAREFTHMRPVEMARQCLEQRGVPTRMLSANQVVQRALHTTSDFVELLTGAGNRILRRGYDSYQGGVRRICRESTAPDFRAKQKLQLGEMAELLLIGEHGEVKYGSMAESKTSYSLASYGRIFAISRQAIVNDDLGAFGDLTLRLGRAAAEFIAAQLAAKLASNPTMSDSVALFHADHGNLGTPGAISITTLGEALKMMRLQKGLDSATPIDVTPKYLVVPAALEVIARQYVAQINAQTSSAVNPFSAQLEVVVDPRLDANSATAWYLAADSEQIDTIEFSFLEGDPGPVIETRAGFDVEGVEMKVRLDFGCGVIDHRGLFKNAGA
jgi:hypothetical protein